MFHRKNGFPQSCLGPISLVQYQHSTSNGNLNEVDVVPSSQRTQVFEISAGCECVLIRFIISYLL